MSHNPFPTYAWIVVAIPLSIALIGILWAATRPLPSRLKRGLGFALFLYLLGALFFEALSGVAWRAQRPNLTDAFGTIEEVLEMGACILAIHPPRPHLVAAASLAARGHARG